MAKYLWFKRVGCGRGWQRILCFFLSRFLQTCTPAKGLLWLFNALRALA